MKLSTVFVVLVSCAALGLACGAPAEEQEMGAEEVDTAQQAIVAGESMSGFWSSGAVAIYYGGDRPCTGVYVAPRYVLTARHCVTAYGAGYTGKNTDPLIALSSLSVSSRIQAGATPNFTNDGTWATVTRIYDPQAYRLPNSSASEMSTLDLAVLRLSNELTDQGAPLRATGKPLDMTNAEIEGQQLLCFGYGMQNGYASSSGEQRRAKLYVDALSSSIWGNGGYSVNLYLPRNGSTHLWHGDSGGPCFRARPRGMTLVSINQSIDGGGGAYATSLLSGTLGGRWVRWLFGW